MAERHKTAVYRRSFKAFLKHTNEKRVLVDYLKDLIFVSGADSLLDIGAGRGDIAIPLSRMVREYVCIEQNAGYAERLRAHGLTVGEGTFPLSVQGTYDIVLSSHSVPRDADTCSRFVDAAARLVARRGVLAVITINDGSSIWDDFRRECGLSYRHEVRDRLALLEAKLRSLGSCRKRVIRTDVRTKELDEMRAALAFVYSNGDGTDIEVFMQNPHVDGMLNLGFLKSETGEYVFPFDHYAFEVTR